MGHISSKLVARLRRMSGQRNALRSEARKVRESVNLPKGIRTIEDCVRSGLDPLHAAYVSVRDFTSAYAEAVSTLDECDPYYQIVVKAEDEYMPGAPPMSPLTASYFTTWAFFDVRFGPDRETIGTCLLDTAPVLGVDDLTKEIVRRFQDSRMGIYECSRAEGGRCRLREPVTGKEFNCHVASGYAAENGQLLYVRLCPPLFDLFGYHVAFTTPYVLLNVTKEDWSAYLNKSILGAADRERALHEFLKFGPKPYHWPEYIFQAYHHHTREAIFLAGIPDVRSSLPHGGLSREP